MKKFGKFILALILVAGVGFTGFTLGQNSSVSKSSSTRDAEHIAQMEGLKSLLDQNFLFDYDDEQIYEGSLKGMFANLGDPYTAYYTPDEFKKLMESLNGRYSGIGLSVQASKEGYIKAVSVFDDSPAKEAGIESGDYITKVNGKAFGPNQLEEAVAEIKGEPGSDVTLTILRTEEGTTNSKEFDVKVTRADVNVDTIDDDILEVRGKKIGYIHIKAFDDITWKDFSDSYSKLMAQDIDGLILDVRNNPGGALDVVINIADNFLDEGVIVTTKDKKGNVATEKSDANASDIPMVVLQNENSASASEILAGAMKDRGRAKVIGTQSFGKGVVQKVFNLEDGAGAKITISEYFTPNGTQINKVGVTPDIKVESDEDLDLSKKDYKNDKQFVTGLNELLKEIK
ncbi:MULTISPECIES: S41 family peptidase [Anaerococcus]|uniref:Carboxy-terminal processing protease CtpB n=2 Tax=Anaerococcus TaxID=165779 RepID=A0A2I1M9B6_9FIRM|nr:MULTISPECIES: S41 family peptidase [Anaerococcus]MBS6106538.1 S41 family peptidase [Anaerococcus sp.]MDU2599654.1 S41 family peptidase [Anaerococcus sp.]MDU4026256.1 S41 family peptidase [Anaerococcus sp.]PKZ16711.1 S41 family peptidase [Anaerococcus octavius]SUU91745.1 Carboxy-terminal processing protease CtpB precursor [Anaerococcus octavius]